MSVEQLGTQFPGNERFDAPDDGGPAFPHPGGASDATVQASHLGLSLRDYFAGQAVIGMIASTAHPSSQGPSSYDADDLALNCFKVADAMLAARKAGG